MKINKLNLALIVLLVVLLVIVLYKPRFKSRENMVDQYPEFAQDTIASLDKSPDQIIMNPKPDPELGPLNSDAQKLPRPVYWDTLSPAQKLQWIIEIYYKPPIKKKTKDEEEKYLKELPQSRNCDNMYSECDKWAANGDCTVNPEFMLYNCPKSCAACELNPDQKYEATRILNKKDPQTCVYYGKPYPDRNRWIWQRVYGAQ